MTDGRPYGRCGLFVNYFPASTQCQLQGITTADSWYKCFSDRTIPGGNRFFH
ncbi:hypothetical protein [Commensalibacter nepenthis]|uniref:Uncharacterized protein n=1 Tax=Commensalibacter nepenthis TaxID=3043872 RepID=A0ABT6Q5C9_9PROT|nr:hypothetical protein [Commensalibacter sp. TBRC 10068]MDI2112106.1 hypothetical protein [Commensalibacter sp. TBRC 10068]